MAFSPLPRLRTGVRSECDVAYSTGAVYKGKIENNQRKGAGVFIWPDGGKYNGEFANNQRQGKGHQVWADGSSYEGDFTSDLRDGQGTQNWADGSSYTGAFFKDRRQGRGKYTWRDGSAYVGKFHIDQREGYGKIVYVTGNTFEGFYRRDERFGPGIQTYADGSQDCGLWQGEKIIKILTPSEAAFTMKNHTDFCYDPEDHVQYIELHERVYNKKSIIDSIIHPPPFFKYGKNEKLEENSRSIFSDSLHPDSMAMDHEVFEDEFWGTGESATVTVKADNATPTLIEMRQHTYRHRNLDSNVSMKPKALYSGPRSAIKKPHGKLEEKSMELIKACAAGDVDLVQDLLLSGDLHPDVSDVDGFTPIHAASVNCKSEVINMLLDHGADVNKLSNEGMTALAMCFVLYYPADSFKENIAEKEYLLTKNPAQFDVTSIATIASNIKQSSSASKQQSDYEQLKKPASAVLIGRDSGFESRKDGNPPQASVARSATSDVGESPALTLATTTPGESPITTPLPVALSENPQEAMSKSPSLISKLSGDKTPARALESCAVSETEEELSAIEGDELSIVESPALSKVSGNMEEDFHSNDTVLNYGIEVTESLVERCATALSMNELVTKRDVDSASTMEKSRRLAKSKAERQALWETIQLLLKRGANPNASCVPMPALVFTIKAADLEATKLLLLKGANANLRLADKKGGLSPLHLAAASPGEEGIMITELILHALGNPDSRATVDNSYLDPQDDWSQMDDQMDPNSSMISGGRTPLHIACSREDDYKSAAQIVHLLLDHSANPNVLCNGHSPLSLAITSGNDLAIEELLKFRADPSLELTHSNGNALCVASHTAYEHRRSPEHRIALIDQLVNAGADILAIIPMGPKKIQGTALDYAYYIFNQDRRIAHMPYHALSHAERETYNARRRLLGHMGDTVRNKCIEREKRRLEEEQNTGVHSRSPSARFLFTGAGAQPVAVRGPDGKLLAPDGKQIPGDAGRVTFEGVEGKTGDSSLQPTARQCQDGVVVIGPYDLKNFAIARRLESEAHQRIRKPLFKYCYNCGRSVNVRLTACTRCKEVYFCSKACKVKAWNMRHKDECVRIQGSPKSSAHGSGGKTLSPPRNKRMGGFSVTDGINCNPVTGSSAPRRTGVVSSSPPQTKHIHDPSRSINSANGVNKKSLLAGAKTPSKLANQIKSAPAKMNRQDPRKAAKDGKSYNVLRRPSDRNLVPVKGLSNSYPNLARGGKMAVRHGHGGGRVSPDLTPHIQYTDNYSFV